ncbi:MAG TPA: hypothetical protein VEI04_09140 [Syntrophobacteria bacterium]|nr:hypothetical protein [Syntrophobacteria bacterium]
MAKIISFEDGRKIEDNLICRQPLEFRRGDWHQGQVIQTLRADAEKYQAHRRQALAGGHRHLTFVPEHFDLVAGLDHTIMGLYRWRQGERHVREVYRLAGLMECVVNASCPLLRTDLLHSLYRAILELRQRLNVSWVGGSSQFILPLHPHLYERKRFFERIYQADTLKMLYEVVEQETTIQFNLLAAEYVFYLPQRLAEREG